MRIVSIISILAPVKKANLSMKSTLTPKASLRLSRVTLLYDSRI